MKQCGRGCLPHSGPGGQGCEPHHPRPPLQPTSTSRATLPGAAEGSQNSAACGRPKHEPRAFDTWSIMQSLSESAALGPLLSAFCDYPHMCTHAHTCAHTLTRSHRVRFILGNKLQTAFKIVCCPFISGPFATPQKFLVLLGIQIHSPLTPALSLREGHTSS